MATTPAGAVISETAKAEGGPTKGSVSAQMQSQVAKQRNAEEAEDSVVDKLETGAPIDPEEARTVQSREQRAMGGVRPPAGSIAAEAQSVAAKEQNFDEAAQRVGLKMQTNPGAVSSEDASYLQSREARLTGGDVPPDSIASDAERLAAANEQGRTSGRPLDPAEQSQLDKEANFQDAATTVGAKILNDPGSVTKEDANLLHSREQRAHGTTEKGGITSQAHHLVAENEGNTK
ncbi:MAG: hypothetical protein M1820_002432 [Bogoriella megaspora]|nr:MAG: hypothetical protein M1820_002432 [Bogoriella megaspora]